MEEQVDSFERPMYQKMRSVYVRFFINLGFLQSDFDNEGHSTVRKILTAFSQFFVCPLILCCYTSIWLLHGLFNAHTDELDISFLCQSIAVTGVSARYVMLFYKRASMTKIMHLWKKLWAQLRGDDEAASVREFEKYAHYTKIFFMWNGFFIVTFFVMTAQLVTIPPEEPNGTATRMLPYPYFRDVHEEPWYTLVTIFQATSCYTASVVSSGMETTCPFLVMMAAGFFRVLKNRISLLGVEPKDSSTTGEKVNNPGELPIEELKSLIRFHQMILQFCRMTQDYASSLFFVQISTTVYNTAIILLKLVEFDPASFKLITVLVFCLIQFFCCQYYAERLLRESEAIAVVSYAVSLQHEHYSKRANQYLLMVIARSQTPVQLTAGGYILLSLENFQQMMLSAFSFFTVLRNVMV